MKSHFISHQPASKSDKLIASLLAFFAVLILTVTAPQIGLTWDEPTYIVAAEIYPAWYKELFTNPPYALSNDGVSTYWTYSHEHPPLSKAWSGFVWLAARHIFDDLTAHRLGNILITGVLIALLYLFVTPNYGRMAGLVAVFALLTMPRFFFHAHLAAIDVPVTATIFAVVYIFWLGHDHTELIWTLFLGLVWGLALITKINALFILPIWLTAWVLVFKRRRYLLLRLVLMGLIGVGIFILCWPWLYHDLLARLVEYVGFMTTERLPVEQFYFGQMFTPPPWHFPFVMTAIVVPFTLLTLAVIGSISLMKHREDRPFAGYLLLGIFVCLTIFTTGLGQVFDNERFMMPVFPYIAALAGIGFARAIPMIERPLVNRGIQLNKKQLVSVMVIVIFVPHLLLASDLYPHLLSYYSEAIGGVYGANFLGMETTYWCETYVNVLPYLNRHAKPGAVVNGECQDVLIYYQLQGQLRSDLQISNDPDAFSAFPGVKLNPATFEQADYVIVQNRQSGHYRALRHWMQARQPVYRVWYRRFRLIEVYRH